MALGDVAQLLSTKRAFMRAFMERYLCAQIDVPRTAILENAGNFQKAIDFCLKTRQRIVNRELQIGSEYFARNYSRIKDAAIAGVWPELVETVYSAPGVGQKIGSLILEVIIHYGELNPALEKKLFVPLDTHVIRILSECLHVQDVPPMGTPFQADKMQRFQIFLKNNTSPDLPRIYFDYLWFVGKVFCTKKIAEGDQYSRGYRLCAMCWIKEHCLYEDKWFAG